MTEVALPQPPEDFDELVQQFATLRDSLKKADDAHKAKTATGRDYLQLLNAKLLERLNATGADSVKTANGTAYRTTRRTASIADGEAFRGFVIENRMWDMVDWKANANAVDDFLRNEQSLPPGVNFTTAYTVGVRRA